MRRFFGSAILLSILLAGIAVAENAPATSKSARGGVRGAERALSFGTLIMSSAPDNAGSIMNDPLPEPFIDKYGWGTVVTLSAIPGPGFAFSHWSGEVSGTENPTSITIRGHEQRVTANFVPAAPASVTDGRPVFQLRQNAPNPFTSSTYFSFSLPRQADASLKVYDTSGRVVRTLVAGASSPGLRTIAWDGRDDSGRRVGAGVYLAMLESGGRRESRRAIVLK